MTRRRIVSAALILVPLLLVASNSLAYASTAFTSGQRGLGIPRSDLFQRLALMSGHAAGAARGRRRNNLTRS
jgi:hypothetical protein